MKDNYVPVPGRTPNALFNKIESTGDLLQLTAYYSGLPPIPKWRYADDEFMRAVLGFVYEVYPPEERTMANVRTLIEMEMTETPDGETELSGVMKGRAEYLKSIGKEREMCLYYYYNFRAYPKDLRRAVVTANYYRFGFADQDRPVTILPGL